MKKWIAALMLVAATATTVHATESTRYTWTGDAARLPQVNLACSKDMENSPIPPFQFGAAGIVRTRYKDCVSGYGYVQARESERGPEAVYTYEVIDGVGYQRYRLESSCGSPDQTCLWIAPSRWGIGGGWGIAPLPDGGR